MQNITGKKQVGYSLMELCDKLRTITGFTNSLQSLELNREVIDHTFTQSEKGYLNYIADRGMDLTHAIPYTSNTCSTVQ
jgi:hypothetical protein